MKEPVVRLKIRVRLPDGSRPFLESVLSANNKLKPLYAIVDGKPQFIAMRGSASASGSRSASTHNSHWRLRSSSRKSWTRKLRV